MVKALSSEPVSSWSDFWGGAGPLHRRAANGLYHLVRRRWVERPHLRAMRDFYRRLPDRRAIFYMYSTSGLLHWVARSAALVPPEVNLVFIGAGLSPDEQQWARQTLRRPFHHIQRPVSPDTVWELLFAINEESFGWLDSDCFVLEPRLFREMAAIDDGVFANSAWSYASQTGIDVLRTYFLFINVLAVRALTRRPLGASPFPFSYEGAPVRYGGPYGRQLTRIPTARQLRLLRSLVPADGAGHPPYPSTAGSRYDVYDTLVFFQHLALARGYRLGKVRDLDGEPQAADGYSSELVHVGSIAYFNSLVKEDPALLGNARTAASYRLLLQASDCVLAADHGLPASYDELRREIAARLAALGLRPEESRPAVAAFLHAKGVAPATIARVFGPEPSCRAQHDP